MICFESKSLGDSLAWMPYVEKFRIDKKSKVICSTFKNDLFEKQYPEIEFVEPGVGQASGIVLALASRAGCAVAQYTPSQVKNTIVGWGSATKDQIGHMVQQRLNLAAVPQPADAADAAAIALCHCSIAPFIASRDAAIARSAR